MDRMPVELVSFQTERQNDQTALLTWRTASELNNQGFDIQRSNDGRSWQTLAFVPGHGTTQEEKSYAYTDERPLPGLNYYRLRQVDFDGRFEYSKVVSVNRKQDSSGISLFPNPASSTVTLALETGYTGEATFTLYDLLGKQMKTATLSLESGATRSDIGLGDLPSGVYLAKVQAGREQWQERLVLE